MFIKYQYILRSKFFILILSALLNSNAFAANLEFYTTHNMSSDETYSNNTTAYVDGIFGDGAINTNGFNLTTSNNTGSFANGIFTQGGYSIIINGTGNNLLTASFNRNAGLMADLFTSMLEVNSMNIIANNNGNYGLAARRDVNVNVNGNGSNTVVANGNGFAGIYSSNAGGSMSQTHMNITGVNIQVNNNGYGFSSENWGSINVLGTNNNTVEIKNNLYSGVYAYGDPDSDYLDTDINMKNVDVVIEDNGDNGIIVMEYAHVNIEGDATTRNILSLKNNGSGYGVYLSGNDNYRSGMSIKNMDVYVDSNDFIKLESSEITLDNSNIIFQDASNGFLFNSSTLDSVVNVNNGSSVDMNGGLLAEFKGTSIGSFNVDSSEVFGVIATGSAATSTMSLNNNAKWYMDSSSNLTNIEANNAFVDIRNSAAGAFNTLTVKNYEGNNSKILMNTALGDDTSLTDKLVIDGGTGSGLTFLDIIDVGSGNGASTTNGIKVVDAVNGATIDAGAFELVGGQVDTSAYVYKLYQGDASGSDTQSYFLRTNGDLTDVAKAIANEPTAILSLTKTGMNSLQKRMGELRENNPSNKEGVWVRSYAKDLKVKGSITTDMTVYGGELGYDYRLDYNSYKIYLGATAGYLKVDNIKNNQKNGAKDGTGDGTAPSVGIYATVLGKNGWFVDGVVRNFWEDLNLVTYSSGGAAVVYRPDRMMTAYSLEVGKQYKYCIDCTAMYIVEPKVEVMYAHADAKSFKSNLGNQIRYGHTDSLNTKASLMLGYKKKLLNGSIFEPFIIAAINREWFGDTNVVYDGVHYKSDQTGTSYELGAGLNMQINKDWSLYSDAIYETGSDIQSISGNLGVRYTW